MSGRRTVEEPAPPRTYRPLRQIVVYLGITYALRSPSRLHYRTPASHR